MSAPRFGRRALLRAPLLLGVHERAALARPPSGQPGWAVTIDGEPTSTGLEPAMYALHGKVKAKPRARVFVAVRRSNAEAWWVAPDAAHVDASGTRWSHAVRIGGDGDAGQVFRVMAAVFAEDGSIETRWIDDQALRRAASAVSPQVLVKRGPDKRQLLEPEARVAIAQLDSQDVGRDPSIVYDVGLTAPVWGHYSGPPGSRVQVVVQPLEGDLRWVQNGGENHDGTWDGSAQFGRDEYHDEWVRFLLYAIVARIPLVPTSYSSTQWSHLLATGQILAVSPVVRTRRAVHKVNGQLTSVRILWINRTPVQSATITRVRQTATIEGDVAGSAMSTRKVAVYARTEGTDGAWRRLGSAISPDNRSWTLLPAPMGENQQRLVVLAVLYDGHPPDLNSPADTARIVAKSPFLRVLVVEPPIEITSIDEHDVGPGTGARPEAPLAVATPSCRVEGARLPNLPQGQIIFYARSELDLKGWRRVGALEGPSSQSWEGAAVDFGGAGSFTLVAALVVDGTQPPADRLPTGAGTHLSPFVHVKVAGR